MNWAEYTDAARRLAEVRRREADRVAALRQRGEHAREEAGKLNEALEKQREELTRLATQLRLPPPTSAGLLPAEASDVDEAINAGKAALAHARTYAQQAERRSYQPGLLPGLPVGARNLVVYSACTVVAAVITFLAFGSYDSARGSMSFSFIAWSVCGLPALAFFAAYAIITFFGRPRVEAGRQPATRSVRLGGLICFVGMWAVFFCIAALL
ncbi:MAG: hypothetical protein J2P15_21060 [Micromonosporaceae bacterium]|nr:hypothetical protein [Micromonosporaceae bacterium]